MAIPSVLTADELVTVDWLNAIRAGVEIGYNQITSPVNVTGLTSGSTTTIITGSGYAFDGDPVIVEFFAPMVTSPGAAAGNSIDIGLYEGASLITRLAAVVTPAAATTSVPVCARQRFTPSAASHTYLIEAWVTNTTGTPKITAGTGASGGFAPCYMRFTKA